jgi:hypothetical protein
VKNFELETIYEELQKEEVKVSDKYTYTHPKKTNGNNVQMSLGRIWFNQLLPDDFELTVFPMNKKEQKKLIQKIHEKYEPEQACDVLDTIEQNAFKMATINPSSFIIDAFLPSKEWTERKQDFQKKAMSMTDEEFVKNIKELTDDYVKELDQKDIGIQNVLVSGTKGGPSDWGALMTSRGLIVDMEGNIHKIPEATNDGFGIDSYYKTGAQARRSMFLKSSMTSKPGYLARRVTMANGGTKVIDGDCKTTKYLNVFIDSSNVDKYDSRFYKAANGKLVKLTRDTYDKLIGKKINFRSPLYCKQKDGICQICYGELSKKLQTANVGIAAGGAINNETVNAMMKLKHKSSQVELIEVDFIKFAKESSIDYTELSTYLDIQKNKIYAKQELTITIDEKEYRDEDFTDTGSKYILPGILEVSVPLKNEKTVTLALPYSFNVNVIKPANVEISGKKHILTYTAGEKILEKENYIKDLNPAIIDRLFEGGMKFITTPEILFSVLRKELTQADSVHLELVAANMFRNIDDKSIPGRLVDYKNCKIYGAKAIPFLDSWLSGMAFENINKAIKVGLVEQKNATLNPIENVFLDKHYGDNSKI